MTLHTVIGLQSARELDAKDPLRRFRQEFLFPQTDGQPDVYFVGNSLGLQPRKTQQHVQQVLDQWHHTGVDGHFQGEPAWIDYPSSLNDAMAAVVGAQSDEVVVMNTLTVNLHLMLATFFQPTAARNRILIEAHAFPSDHQAVTSHLQLRNCDPETSLVLVRPEPGTQLISTEQIIDVIHKYRDSLALIMLPGVQYYTGQVFAMQRLTAAAHQYDIPVGFDLAHAAGNIPLALHDWDVDFACWCTYKYLNSGPGALGGCFIHSRHVTDRSLPRLAGWWGHERSTRFQMAPEFIPDPTAMGWQLSNPPILALAPIRSSLELVEEAGGIETLRAKSLQLSAFFRDALRQETGDSVHVLTPADPAQSGCQLSLEIQHAGGSGKDTFRRLQASAVHTDWREPNVIRAAPVPLYNSFEDIWRFVTSLKQCLD